MLIANKMNTLCSAIFSQLNAEKLKLMKEGHTLIDFSIGTPDLPPHPKVLKALSKACLKPENYRYAISDTAALIDSVKHWYELRYDVLLESHEIVSLLGSQSGFAEIALCLLNPGDTVLVPSPGYPIFSIAPLLAEAHVVTMPLLEKNNYLIDFEAIDEEVARTAKLMIVSYPNNPTTAIAPYTFYEKLVAFAKKYNIIVLHDNAYSELVFTEETGDSFLSVPGAKDVGIEFNSLSKTYNIPGCRIAFAMGNAKIIDALKTLKSHTDYGMFLPFQEIATLLLDSPKAEVEEVRQTYLRRGTFLIEALNEIGWSIPKASGTMFIWAPLPKGYTSSLDFTYDLLYKAHVMVVPGISFGEEGEGYVRIALVEDEVQMQEAVTRIAKSGVLL